MTGNREPVGNWKAIRFNFDFISSLSEDGCIYCLTEQEVALLLAALEPTAWATRWYSPSNTTIDTAFIRRLSDGISAKLMSNLCTDMTNGLYQVQQGNIAVINNQRLAMWSPENPQSIDTNCPATGTNFETGGGGGAAGDDALCVACEAFVRHKLDETLKLYAASLGTAAVATGVLAALTGGLGAIFGGAVVILAGIAYANVQAAAGDDSAIHKISCDLYNALKGQVATQAHFISAIDGLTGGTANETTIVSILKAGSGSSSYLGGQQRLSNYLHFLQILGGAVVSVQNGQAECTCGLWCYNFEFSLSNGGWSVVAGAGGTYSGEWQSTTVIGAGGAYYNQCYIEIPIASSEITYVSFGGNKVRGDSAADVDGLQLNSTFVATWDANFNGRYDRVWTGDEVGVTMIRLYVVAGENHYPPGGSATITNCKIKGRGTNPFGADNCTP